MGLMLNSYDHIIVFFSGGKDSTACILHLLDTGVPKEKIELWHHDTDGASQPFIDWGVTLDYCKKFSEALNIPLYFSYRVGGFEAEMLRENSRTNNVRYNTPGGWKEYITKRGKKSTRRKFPQISPNLAVRWCTAYLKIDVARLAVNNQERFRNKKILFVSGERAEESAARAKHKRFEIEKPCDNRNGKNKRHVDRWRPVHEWSEQKVWDIIEKHKINPHPCYHAGFGRCSCQFCIFGNKNQFKSAEIVSPERFKKLCDYEREFQCTLKRNENLKQLVYTGTPYRTTRKHIDELNSTKYTGKIFVENWQIPAGAFGEPEGPS